MANTSMTSKALQAWLKSRYPVENERHEWKGWQSLRKHVSVSAGDDVLSYASALANMDGGTLVIGVEDKTLRITGIADLGDFTPENLPQRLAGNCAHLPVEGLRVDDHYYKTLILQHIRRFKSVSLSEVRELLLNKLPDSLTQAQKLVKLRNLLAALRTTGLDGTKIVAVGAGRTTRWVIFKAESIG